MKNTTPLHHLPAIDEVLRHPAVHVLESRCSRQELVDWARQAVAQCRQELLAGNEFNKETLVEAVLAAIQRSFQAERDQAIQPVINATGILLHTNLGRAPLAPEAVQRMQAAAAYANVELDLGSGKRNRRGARASRLLAKLTGAEDAVVVNNCAAATMLVLQAVACSREVIVSRGQLVEIGGGFRLPEVFTAAGVILREVGTTNRTYLKDYERALEEATGAIIRVHRSNFAQHGFVTEPSIDELATLCRSRQIPLIDDLGSGCVVDLRPYGIQEPTVMDSLEAGADLCLFSGDKLFGGPQCGIIVGRQACLDRVRTHPMMRALRPDKTTLAALEATTEIHLTGEACRQLPLYQMLTRTPHDVRAACESLKSRMDASSGKSIQVVPCVSHIGGGSLPAVELSSYALSIRHPQNEIVARALRQGAVAVQCRQADDQLVLDLRTVMDHQQDTLAQCLHQSLAIAKNDGM